jgi:peptidylamidoglycolate lyase
MKLWSVAVGLACLTLPASGAPPSTAWHVVATWPPVPASVMWGQPSSVTVDQEGRVLIFHRGEAPLLRFNRSGELEDAWGSGMFKMAHGLKVAPDGNIWVTDARRHIIVKFSPAGKQLLRLGTPDEPGTGRTHFGGVADIAFLANGDFYAADGYQNSRVIKFDKEGRFLAEWGRKGTGPGEFNLPHAIAVDSKGLVYVADRENRRIQVFTPMGQYVTEWHVIRPFGMAMTPRDELWVADAEKNRVVQLDLKGEIIDSFEPPDPTPGELMGPHMLGVDKDGGVYVAETRRLTVRKFAKRPR